MVADVIANAPPKGTLFRDAAGRFWRAKQVHGLREVPVPFELARAEPMQAGYLSAYTAQWVEIPGLAPAPEAALQAALRTLRGELASPRLAVVEADASLAVDVTSSVLVLTGGEGEAPVVVDPGPDPEPERGPTAIEQCPF